MFIKSSQWLEKSLLMLTDSMLSFFCIYLSVNLFPPEWQTRYLTIGVVGALVFVIIANYHNLYQKISSQNLYETAIKLTQIWLLIGLVTINIAFLVRDTENLARNILLVWMVVTPIVLLCNRLLFKMIIPKKAINILMIGDEYSFTSHELNQLKLQKISLIKCNNTDIKTIKFALSKNTAHRILINLHDPNASLTQYITQINLSGIMSYTLGHFMEHYLCKCYIPYDANGLQYLDNIKPYTKSQLLIKAVIDYLGAILLSLASIPFVLFIAYKIKRQSPGDIVYEQRRVGKDNREFVLKKFRSMDPNAEKQGARFASKNDARVFPFGEVMRKTRIDELPQFFNILKRDIHFVGPRAERQVFIKNLELEIPYYNNRHIVKPGITGWAQVNYPYGANIEDARQKLMFDLYYIKNWSLALELETLVKTIKVVLAKQGV